MKTLKTVLALCACTIPVLSAQTAAPAKAKEAPAKEVTEVKADTPVEKQAFKIFDTLTALPGILGSIKDEASATAAKAKLDAMTTKLLAQAEELKKLEVPDNDARIKLSEKMELKQKPMSEEMQGVFGGMAQLPESVGEQIGQMMEAFGAKMEELSPTMDKYFEPDAEKGE
ncbi:hypothetical protein V2O64_16110 [Verrucomicrobiaceae bacterium 227]